MDKGIIKPEQTYFRVRTANEATEEAARTPRSSRLFGDLIFENEVAILFADTNVGKSALAVQIADAVSRGHSPLLPFKVETPPKQVLYFDFELSSMQFNVRYSCSETDQWHKFCDTFNRFELNTEYVPTKHYRSTLDLTMDALNGMLVGYRDSLVIIDNITYISDETENAKAATPIMKHLKQLVRRHGVTILALAHTPKRDSSLPIGRNDLQGSKMIINFCDSAFTIGESYRNVGLRYIKHIKSRNTEIVMNEENVMLCQLRKENAFLGFHFADFGNEREHLCTEAWGARESRRQRAIDLRQQGLSLRQIGAELGISRMSAQRYIKGVVEDDEEE